MKSTLTAFLILLINGLLSAQEKYSFSAYSIECGGFDRVSELNTDDLPDRGKEAAEFQLKKNDRIVACKYLVVSWGCGTGCQSHALFDLESGQITGFLSSTYGIDFNEESRLIRANKDPIHKIEAKFYLIEKGGLIELE